MERVTSAAFLFLDPDLRTVSNDVAFEKARNAFGVNEIELIQEINRITELREQKISKQLEIQKLATAMKALLQQKRGR